MTPTLYDTFVYTVVCIFNEGKFVIVALFLRVSIATHSYHKNSI